MKKVIATLGFAALCAVGANAQAVLGYTVSESSGTYSALDNPTVIFDGSNTDAEQSSSFFPRNVITPEGLTGSAGSAEGFSIGFNVDIAGASYDNFLVSTAGYVMLGNGEQSYNPMMGANFMTYVGDYTVAGFALSSGVTYNDETTISYQTLGSGDDSRLVVQFENYLLCYNYWGEPAPVDIQIVVYKQGKVQLVFDRLSALGEDVSINLYVGLRQNENYVSIVGSTGDMSVQCNNRGNLTVDAAWADGTTVTLNVPSDCVKPEAQPTNLDLTSTSDSVEGSFEPSADADTYLVVYAPSGVAGEAPVNGTIYAEDDKLGEATVAYFGPATSFEVSDLPGGTEYTYTIYAANSYGLNGPVYNTEAPLTSEVATFPAPAGEVVFTASSLTSLTMTVEPNEANDDVVVVYNTYCERDNFGDHGYFGVLAPDAKVGDVLPVPEDFTPYWDFDGAELPANACTVAYVGKAGEITISDLDPSSAYYVAVYTRDEAGKYTTDPVYTGYATYMEIPYDGNSYNFPRYELPYGWTGSEAGASTYGFRDEEFVDRATWTPRQGSQFIQQRANITRGDAINGKEAWMTPAPLYVNDRHCMVTFNYCITQGVDRFTTSAYNDWAEDDVLEIRLSEDNGETWVAVATYTAAEHPKQEETLSYVSISADLNAYRGQTVLVQLYWKTFNAPAFGSNMYVDRFSVLQAEFPAVPEVSVNKITHESAVISWVSKQTDYELVYAKVGDNVTHTVAVEGASSYTITGLEPETEYTVKVRGLLEGSEEAYSEWSDPVEFTTEGYPAVDAPENLESDTTTFEALGYVQLSWSKATDAESYEVAYREASSTEWIYKNCTATSLLLTDLEGGKEYIWKVRAFCTHDRETPYSAQVRFTAPQLSGVSDVELGSVEVSAGAGYVEVKGAAEATVGVYNAAGVAVAAVRQASSCEHFDLRAGLYIVVVGDQTYKVIVR